MKKRMTVKDLAEIAGVDHSTVSRALNDSPRVRAETKRKIQEIARLHNFSFDSNARSLSSRKTGVIGIIYPAAMEDFNSSLYTGRLFMDLRKELERLQLDGILLEARHPESGSSNIVRLIRENKVDGFVILHEEIPSADYEQIIRWDLPVVQVHLQPHEYPVGKLDFFSTDNIAGGMSAAGHLAELDCGNFHNVTIARCCGLRKDAELKPGEKEFASETGERTLGFMEGLSRAGVSGGRIRSCDLDGSYQSGRNFVLGRSRNMKQGDGIFFHSDLMAFGALIACREIGVSVPDQLRIMGFDDSPIAILPEGGITTVHQPREIIARNAAERIRFLLDAGRTGADRKSGAAAEKDKVREKTVPELVIRKSTVNEGDKE